MVEKRTSLLRKYLWEKCSLSYRAAKEASLKLSDEGEVENLRSRDPSFVKVQTFFYVLFDLWFFFIVGTIGSGLLNHTLPTRERGFFCGDASIAQPHYPNTISVRMLLSVTMLCPLIIVIGWEYVHVYVLHRPAKITPRQRIEMMRRYGAGVAAVMVEYMFVMLFIMEIGKNAGGRLRPHFLSVCKPDPLKVDCSKAGVWIPEAFCTGNAHDIRVGRQSFPSGHSSAGIYCAVWLGLYLLGRLPSDGSPASLLLLRQLASLGMGFFGVVCCVSRVTDFWHFPTDVAAGLVLGVLCAVWIAWRDDAQMKRPRAAQPPLASSNSDFTSQSE